MIYVNFYVTKSVKLCEKVVKSNTTPPPPGFRNRQIQEEISVMNQKLFSEIVSISTQDVLKNSRFSKRPTVD